MAEVIWELPCLPDATGESGRVGFPAKNYISSKPYSFHSVHSAIGSRMNEMIFRSFRKRNSSQKKTNTVYSEYSYCRVLSRLFLNYSLGLEICECEAHVHVCIQYVMAYESRFCMVYFDKRFVHYIVLFGFVWTERSCLM